MGAPFPGMDPYLEAPDIWPDFHDRLAGQISAELNQTLPAPYYARLVMRPEVGIGEDSGGGRRIVPDVAVARRPDPAGGPPVAVLVERRGTPSRSLKITVKSEPLHHATVEIRDPRSAHQLVTLIEIVSPSNKRPGADRRMYLQKQREVLDSDTSLIELDLLRHGERLLPNLYVDETLDELQPHADYVVFVNRAWDRIDHAMGYEIFPFQVGEMLPCIPVPLREKEPEILLDLQIVFNHVYDTGPYRRGAVDYSRPPEPPLTGEAAAWAEQRIKDWLAAPPPA